VASPDWVRLNRSDLWAEAVYREGSGEAIWLDDELVQDKAVEAQSERMSEDMWGDAIAVWLRGHFEVRVPEIMSEALSIPRERQGKAQEMRVGAILRRLGWTKGIGRRGANGALTKLWFAPGREAPVPDETGQNDLLYQ
jgi:putative DNA primase/helicase